MAAGFLNPSAINFVGCFLFSGNLVLSIFLPEQIINIQTKQEKIYKIFMKQNYFFFV